MAKRRRNENAVQADMQEQEDNKPVSEGKEEHEDIEEDLSFEQLGLDPRLIRALSKKSIENPTPIQRVAIPLILEGKDVVARAKTGSGKTYAYLLPLLQKLFTDSPSKVNLAPVAVILVPTRELSQQVYSEVISLIELCRVQLKVVQLASNMSASETKTALTGLPDILVSTPACVKNCLLSGTLKATDLQESLSVLILDEADLLLSYGYEDDLKAFTAHVPKRCQCLLMSATSSDDVEKLKKLILHNPYILTLPEVGNVKDDIIPKNVQQFYISCSARDKLVHILALLKLELVQKKVLIFTNSIDMSFRLKLFFEQFGIKSAVLNAELPQNSRLHILEEFNAGLFDYLIATDESKNSVEQVQNDKKSLGGKKSRKNSKRKLDEEFSVVRGVDFKNVHTVVNFEMPQSAAGYVHRIGRTGRAYNAGASVSLVKFLELEPSIETDTYERLVGILFTVDVSPEEMEIFEEIKSILGEKEIEDSKFIAPFPLLTMNAVESLRYRAEDVARSITKVAVRESRAQDLRNEILNSEKLKAHFQDNPRDLDLLKHDKLLSKKMPAPHLRIVPEYLLDPTTQEASKIVKLARAAMGNTKSAHRKGLKGKFKRSRDPLKTFSAEVPKRAHKTGTKNKGKDGNDGHSRMKKLFV